LPESWSVGALALGYRARQAASSTTTVMGFNPPLSAIAKMISKHAPICGLLLVLSMVTLFVFIALGIQI
jgi:hypothetical protein